MRLRTYWAYSGGLIVAWALVFGLTALIRGSAGVQTILPVFLGYVLGWVSTTIARYVYPPPRKYSSSAAG